MMLIFTINDSTDEVVILENTLTSTRRWIAPKLGLNINKSGEPLIAVGYVSVNIFIVCPENFTGTFRIHDKKFTEQLVSQCKQIDLPDIKYIENFKRIKMK